MSYTTTIGRGTCVALAATFLFATISSGVAQTHDQWASTISTLAQGLPRDVEKLKERAANGDTSAMITLAELSVVEDKPDESLVWFEQAAKSGSVEAMVRLHDVYALQLRNRPDAVSKAKYWMDAGITLLLTKAADNTTAARHLAYLYDLSDNGAEAIRWYSKAAAQGSPEAMEELGTHYQLGWGVPEDSHLAVQWLSQAAALGDAKAMRTLSNNYGNGNGVGQDINKANDLLKNADLAELNRAEAGDQAAMLSVATRYLNSHDPLMVTKGTNLLARAATSGNWQAAVDLALAYRLGKGVEKNATLADHWNQVAMNIGMPLNKFNWPED